MKKRKLETAVVQLQRMCVIIYSPQSEPSVSLDLESIVDGGKHSVSVQMYDFDNMLYIQSNPYFL